MRFTATVETHVLIGCDRFPAVLTGDTKGIENCKRSMAESNRRLGLNGIERQLEYFKWAWSCECKRGHKHRSGDSQRQGERLRLTEKDEARAKAR